MCPVAPWSVFCGVEAVIYSLWLGFRAVFGAPLACIFERVGDRVPMSTVVPVSTLLDHVVGFSVVFRVCRFVLVVMWWCCRC